MIVMTLINSPHVFVVLTSLFLSKCNNMVYHFCSLLWVILIWGSSIWKFVYSFRLNHSQISEWHFMLCLLFWMNNLRRCHSVCSITVQIVINLSAWFQIKMEAFRLHRSNHRVPAERRNGSSVGNLWPHLWRWTGEPLLWERTLSGIKRQETANISVWSKFGL